MESQSLILIITIVVLCILFYFIPSFIAYSRKHDSKGWVLFLNFILGWSGLVWIFCLIWAAFGKTNKRQ